MASCAFACVEQGWLQNEQHECQIEKRSITASWQCLICRCRASTCVSSCATCHTPRQAVLHVARSQAAHSKYLASEDIDQICELCDLTLLRCSRHIWLCLQAQKVHDVSLTPQRLVWDLGTDTFVRKSSSCLRAWCSALHRSIILRCCKICCCKCSTLAALCDNAAGSCTVGVGEWFLRTTAVAIATPFRNPGCRACQATH